MNNEKKEQKNTKPGFFKRENPRISSLDASKFIKEVILFQNAMDQLEYPKQERFESEWASETYLLTQWLKSYYKDMLDDLASFLKLDKKDLSVNLIDSGQKKDLIESFIREKGTIFNIMATMTNYRKLRLKWVLLASHVTYDSSLPPRDKEILILRIAWLCGSHYEWNHHVLVGKRVGLSVEEIEEIKTGSKAQGWDTFDKLLLNSVDELYENRILSDTTWDGLSKKYDEKQLMDLIFVIGAYNMLAMFMNSVGFKTEECVEEQLKEN